jgi:hypothetical protein
VLPDAPRGLTLEPGVVVFRHSSTTFMSEARMPRRGLALAAALVVACAAAFACDDDATDGDQTATTPEPPATATEVAASPTSNASQEIRDEDLTQQPGLSNFLATAGGEVQPDAIIYADLTEDGMEDAVVPVSSGGEGGDIAVFVYGYVDDALSELLMAQAEDTSIEAIVEDGHLVTTEGIFAEGDPMCCPSTIRHKTYAWNGTALVVESQADEAQGAQEG